MAVTDDGGICSCLRPHRQSPTLSSLPRVEPNTVQGGHCTSSRSPRRRRAHLERRHCPRTLPSPPPLLDKGLRTRAHSSAGLMGPLPAPPCNAIFVACVTELVATITSSDCRRHPCLCILLWSPRVPARALVHAYFSRVDKGSDAFFFCIMLDCCIALSALWAPMVVLQD